MAESKSDAMHVAHSLSKGTLNRIVVLDEQGDVESEFPPPPAPIDGA